MKKTHESRGRGQRGIALPMVGLYIIALAGTTALGVDYARLALTANEAQVVADAAAQSGALALARGGDVNDAAHGVAGENYIDGSPTSEGDLGVEIGAWDEQKREFNPGEAPPDAVRATATRTVNNIFAPIIGGDQSTVSRSAVSVIGPATSAVPDLPVALSNCHFPEDCEDPTCLPELMQTPSGDDNSAFTGFFDNASSSLLRAFMPAECGGSETPFPTVTVGDDVSLNNGSVTSFMQAFECTVCTLGINEFTVPVINHCDENFNSSSPPDTGGNNGVVYGFANIEVQSFNYSNGSTGCNGPGSPQSVNLQSVVRLEGGIGGSGPCEGCSPSGTDGASLVF